MEVMGVTEDEKSGIIRVLAGILHLGNITFSGSEEKSAVENKKMLARAADQAAKKGWDPTFWTGHVDQVAKGPGAHYARKTLRLATFYRGYVEAIRRAEAPDPARNQWMAVLDRPS